MTTPTSRPRIMTGMRPTGALHLGHYGGALENWLRLQHDYECFFLIADYQVSDYADQLDEIRGWVWEVVTDWLAVGLDPEISHFGVESLIPEHAELTTWLSWWVPLGRLQRNPTLKAEMDDLGESVPVAFFTYPVMQAANILMPRAHLVPVGEDQLPHIEMTREVARRFNRLFGKGEEVFVVPRGLVGRVPRLVGIDGPDQKMSKSRNNAIWLKDPPDVVTQKVMRMYTDPTRLHATDPGHVEGNPVFMYHDAFNPSEDEVGELKERYRAGTVGDVEVKQRLARALNAMMDPIRDRRAHFEAHPELVREALHSGIEAYRAAAQETLVRVRDALRLDYLS